MADPEADADRLCYRQGSLHLGNRSVKDLIESIGTPAFVVSEARIRSNYQALTRGLVSSGARVIIRYCAKTNNEAGVLRVLAALGSGCLTSHSAEADLALACGFPPHRLSYQRPVVSRDELRSILRVRGVLVHAFDFDDLDQVEAVAAGLDETVSLSLRLRVSRTFRQIGPLGRLGSRLGFDEDEILDAAARVASFSHVRLHGINTYLGTQQASSRRFETAIGSILRLSKRLSTQLGQPIAEVNLGGGIPSPSLRRWGMDSRWRLARERRPEEDPTRALQGLAARLGASFFRQAAGIGLDPLPTLAFEPGRSLVGNAGLLLTRIRAARGNWLFLDASRNHLPESPVLFQRQILPVTTSRDRIKRSYNISGPTLNTMDVFALRRKLPEQRVGEALAICDAGAYSISRASRYAGLSPPVFLTRMDGRIERIRRPEGLADLTSAMDSFSLSEGKSRVR